MDMKKLDRTALKSFFVRNAVPTTGNFADLIDGLVNQKEDGIAKLPGEPLSVQAEGADTDPKKVLNFYRNFADPEPAWTLSLNPRVDPNNAASAKPGWSLGDGGGTKLFIDQTSGNIGIGTIEPGDYKLNVRGGALFTGNYLYASAENAGRLRVGAAWGMPGLYSGEDGAKALMLGAPPGQKVYLGQSTGDAYVESGSGNSYFKGSVGIGTAEFGAAKLTVAGGFKAASIVSGERAIGLERPKNASHRGDGAQAATGLVYRVLDNPASGDPIFQITSSGHYVRFFAEHDGWTGSRDNSAWFGGPRANFFKSGVGIGTTTPAGALEVKGCAVISNGDSFAVKSNYMTAGSLTVGSTSTSYGGGNQWNNNLAGLLLETSAKTEIAVHDANTRVASLMYYEGEAVNRITIGRNMGWGPISQVVVSGAMVVSGEMIVGTDIAVDGKHAIRGNDAWLRLNQQGVFTSGVHTPGLFAPMSLNVGGVGGWGNPGNGNATIAGKLDVWGDLLGAARNAANQAQRVRCGETSPSAWVAYGKNGVYVDIDASSAGFGATPVYVASLAGTSGHWATTGGSSIYQATKSGFRVYVRWASGAELTPAQAAASGWHITWIAIGN